MKAKITRLDGAIVELDGTVEEIVRALSLIEVQVPIYIPSFTIVETCTHEFPAVWFGTVPPSCSKCGQSQIAEMLPITYTYDGFQCP